MNIALVRTASNILRYGGYNIQEVGLAKALLPHGVSTDIYARFSNIEERTIIAQMDNATVTICPLKGKRIYREIMYYPKLKDSLCNKKYDIVQLLDDSQMMLPFLFKSLKKEGIKTILWQGMYRNFDGKIARSMQFIYDKLYAATINKYSDLKIAKTEAAKQYLTQKGYQNIIVLPVGLDYVAPHRNPKLEEQILDFKKKYPHILLYIGAIENRRDINFIIDVFKSLNDKNTGLIIVGDGPNYIEIEKKINNFPLKDQCLLYKRIPNNELISIFEQTNIFLLPTKYEIYGMVVLESLYNRIPVISTPEAGPQSILINNRLGKCIPLEKNKWNEAIHFYLKQSQNQEDRLYRKQYIESNYRWNKIAEKYHAIISNLITK